MVGGGVGHLLFHVLQARRQQFRGRLLFHPQHDERAQIAYHLPGPGLGIKPGHNVRQSLGVGRQLKSRATGLIRQWHEFTPHQLVELIRVD